MRIAVEDGTMQSEACSRSSRRCRRDPFESIPLTFRPFNQDWRHMRCRQHVKTAHVYHVCVEASCFFPLSSITNIAPKSCESITNLFSFRNYTRNMFGSSNCETVSLSLFLQSCNNSTAHPHFQTDSKPAKYHQQVIIHCNASGIIQASQAP